MRIENCNRSEVRAKKENERSLNLGHTQDTQQVPQTKKGDSRLQSKGSRNLK